MTNDPTMEVLGELLNKTNDLIEKEETRLDDETTDPAERRKHYIRIFAASALPAVVGLPTDISVIREVARIAFELWYELERRFKKEESRP